MILIPPKRICLSGGGIRGVGFIGALEELERHKLLRNVKEYIGVSAGAFVSFAICIGYSLQELKKLCLEFDFSLIRSIEPEYALNFFDEYGLDSGEQLEKLLGSLLKQKGLPQDITFGQMRERRAESPQLRCYATDMNDCCAKEFSAKATPEVKMTTALRASMCLPFYFKPVEDPMTGHLLIDGGILNNYPMAFLTPDERKDCLGLLFSTGHYRSIPLEEFEHFLTKLYGCIFLPRIETILEKTAHQTIILPKGEYPMWHFEADQEDRKQLIEAAANATRKFLDMRTGAGSVPFRRFSVG